MPRVSVVVPTFREARNLPPLVARIARAVAAAGLDAELIVIDDDSRDGTVEVCDELRRAHSLPLRLIVRTAERGLSSAVVAGLSAARGDLLVVVDADLSHPPEAIPALVAALDDPRSEFAMGSRYVPGAALADDWGLLRLWNSRAATALARPLTRVSDPMAGFFALRREDFLRVRPLLNPIGYKIALELVVKGRFRRVAEIPITFADRLHGQSKLTVKEQLNYLRHLHRLYDHRFPWWAGFVRFVLVGCTGMALDLALFAALLLWLPLAAARGLAIWGAMSWNFALNRRFTFRGGRADAPLPQYLRFCGSCLLGAAASLATSVALAASPLFATWHVGAAVVGILAGSVVNYQFCRLVAFKSRQAAPRLKLFRGDDDVQSDAIRRAA